MSLNVMDAKFAAVIEHLAPKCAALVVQKPTRRGEFPAAMPKAGIYLFSTPTENLYVGRTNNLRARYNLHCLPGATEKQAAFAFKLARIETGFVKPTYAKGEGSREWLMRQPVFVAAFTRAKQTIREMDFRFVEEADPNRQALLEIYCAITLDAKHNDFDTH